MLKKIFFTLALVYSGSLFAADLSVSDNSGIITASICGLPSSATDIKFYVHSTQSVGQPANSISGNCATKVYNNTNNALFMDGATIVATYVDSSGLVTKSAKAKQAPAPSSKAQVTVIDQGNQVEVRICGSKSALPFGSVVAVMNPRNNVGSTSIGIQKGETQNCASYTYNQSDIKNGDKLRVVIGNNPVIEKTITEIKGGGNNSGGATNPPPPPQDKYTPAEVRQNAENAARFFANRVVETYGVVENYRYNFFVGFREIQELYHDFGVSITKLDSFERGEDEGRAQGKIDGYSAGQEKGNTEGRIMGRDEARSRFLKAVDKGEPVNTVMGPAYKGENFTGIQSPLLSPKSINERLTAYDAEFMADVRKVIILDGEVVIVDDIFNAYWKLADFYTWDAYKTDLLMTSWRGENAFYLYANQKLTKKGQNLIDYLDNVSDSNKNIDAANDVQIYRSAFINEYESVIFKKWNDVVKTPNPKAKQHGRIYFEKALNDYAYEAGYVNSYKQIYLTESKKGYKSTVAQAYAGGFESNVKHYSANPVIEGVNVELVNQSGLTSFAIIDSIRPKVKTGMNVGQQKGEVRISLSSPSIHTLSQSDATHIEGLSTLKKEVTLGSLSQVGTGIAPDSKVTVAISVNGIHTLNQSISVSWRQTVQQLAKESGQRQTVLLDYIKYHLLQEWFKMSGMNIGDSPYIKKQTSSLLYNLAITYKAMSPADQKAFDQHQEAIMHVFGARPTGWFDTKKDDWDAAIAIFEDQMGWTYEE